MDLGLNSPTAIFKTLLRVHSARILPTFNVGARANPLRDGSPIAFTIRSSYGKQQNTTAFHCSKRNRLGATLVLCNIEPDDISADRIQASLSRPPSSVLEDLDPVFVNRARP